MKREETIQALESIEKRVTDFPYMTAEDWAAIASAKRYLQENPVSPVWHNSNEEQPKRGSNVVVLHGDGGGGGSVLQRVINVNPDNIWAYVDDLLNITYSVIKISDQEQKTEYVLYGVDGRNPQENEEPESRDKQPTFVPKFRIGQRIRHKGGLGAFKIDRIVGMQYVGENGEKVGIVVQDDWELVEEPVNDDLDVLIKDLQEHYRCTKGYPATFYASNIEFVVRHVAEWQKQQLMKDVVEAEYWDGSLFKNELRERFKDGDKVKLIIIKENEEVIKS